MKNIHLICAARPNFMKIAPLYHALKDESSMSVKIIHVGQHYDYTMSQAFFDDFNLPEPHFHLGVGSGTHAEQTAKTMLAYEELCSHRDKPDLVVVVGDVNATLACCLVAKKLNIEVAHLEAGLRSLDRTMPEEINRLVVDSICDYHWVPSEDAIINLKKEGVADDKIKFVGNIMIDSYCMLESRIKEQEYYKKFALSPKQYAVMTIHRPFNVDTQDALEKIINIAAAMELPIIFPVHPRTKSNLNKIDKLPNNLIIIEPLGYIEFMSLVTGAKLIVSDSGGLQEETTYLRIPCYTLRDNTERPITITLGTNNLVNTDNILNEIQNIHNVHGEVPPLWDGKTALRIKKLLLSDIPCQFSV